VGDWVSEGGVGVRKYDDLTAIGTGLDQGSCRLDSRVYKGTCADTQYDLSSWCLESDKIGHRLESGLDNTRVHWYFPQTLFIQVYLWASLLQQSTLSPTGWET
jgi:hypothetical protein